MVDFLKKVNNDEMKVIAIDFDGVIHKNSLGFHDGKVYDEPIKDSVESIKKLAESYELVIFTCKALPDRPLIDGKTGKELIWEWLSKYGLSSVIRDVTHEKPRALLYIDDKGFRFENWKSAISFIEEISS